MLPWEKFMILLWKTWTGKRLERMTELKEQAELLYKHLSETDAKRILGIANGKYKIPDDIDECNDEITEMFEMKKI